MKSLRRFLKGFESTMAAAAFAEEGEFDTAVNIALDGKLDGALTHEKTGEKSPAEDKAHGIAITAHAGGR